MLLFITIYYLTAVLFEIYTFRKFFITPGFVFIGMQLVMFTGILTYLDYNNKSDLKLVLIYLLALIIFILGDSFGQKLFPAKINFKRVNDKDTLSLYQISLIVLMEGVSLLLCTYFFVSSGYNVFLMTLRSIVAGGVRNYTDARIALNNVAGVGYIYQFRVIIFPLLTAFLFTIKKPSWLHRLGAFLLPIMIVFVLGTGQRGGFVMFILMWLTALFYIYKFYRDKRVKKWIVIVCASAFALFFVMTIFNGRVKSGGTTIQAIIQRIFDDNQQCAVVAFRYIDTQPIQWGKDWLLSIRDILPGKNEYLQLSYIIFGIMYGTTRGTAPPCIWGSAYYNFGFIGVIFMSFVLGIAYRKLYSIFAKSKVTKLSIFIYAAMFVVLGNWIADTPLVLFNQGFITLYLMKIILRVTPKYRVIIGGQIIE